MKILKKTILPYQSKILQANKRIIAVAAGRGTGKTFAGALWVLKKLFSSNFHHAIICAAPTYRQSFIVGKYIRDFLNELSVEFWFGSRPPGGRFLTYLHFLSFFVNNYEKNIYFASLDVAQNIRGLEFADAYIDEAAFLQKEDVQQVLFPTIRGFPENYSSQILLTSTPAGKTNWFFEYFSEQKHFIQPLIVPFFENHLIYSPQRVKEIENEFPDRYFRQEFLAEFLDTTMNSIFYEFSNAKIIENQVKKFEKYFVSLDQNVEPGAGILIGFDGKQYIVLDEIYIQEGAKVSLYALEILNILKKYNIQKFTICGDRSGNSRNLFTLNTFYQELISLLKSQVSAVEISDKTLTQNPRVFDSAEIVNSMFKKNQLFVSKNCTNLIKDLTSAEYDEKLTTNKKKYDPHFADCLRYFAYSVQNSSMFFVNKL